MIEREEKGSVVLPKRYARKLTFYARALGMRYDKFARGPPKGFPKRQGRESGIREKENLMTLLKSIALYNGRTRVNEEDFNEFRRLWKYINFKFNYFKLGDTVDIELELERRTIEKRTCECSTRR